MIRFSPSIRASVLFATLSAAAPAAAQEPTILVGANVGVPTKASIGLGTGQSVGDGRLLFMMIEPGIAGGRASVGLALPRHPTPLLRATWLRTWGSPVGAVRDRNYFGPEFQLLGPYGLGVRGGVLFPIGRARGPATSLGVTFGF